MHISNLFKKTRGYLDSFGVIRNLEVEEEKEKLNWLKSHPSLLTLHRRDMLRQVNYLNKEMGWRI